MKKITVVGSGYVGMSMSILLSRYHEVIALDIDSKKVELINARKSPIKDKEIELYLHKEKLNLKATTEKEFAYKDCDYVLIATPTDYDVERKFFDTSSVESVINDVTKINKSATIIIKSTIPIGFTDKINKIFSTSRIIFSPEFLREGKALKDNLYPSRIIIGSSSKEAMNFANILVESSLKNKNEIDVLFTNSAEAEAIKLFSNTYLAMRVSFFNELDTFCEQSNLDAKQIIDGVSLDPRIGNYYNNPSFGYGGYCLPKDTKQLLANYENIPNKIIKAIVDSNVTRKNFIVESILKRNPKTVGVYGLSMKKDSDNFRYSAILDVIDLLHKKGVNIIIHEPLIKKDLYEKFLIINDLEKFKSESDIIISNRASNDLKDVKSKLYSRDIYGNN